MKYFIVLGYTDGQWSIEFGDYDIDVAIGESWEMLCSEQFENVAVHTLENDSQEAIWEVINKLNGMQS